MFLKPDNNSLDYNIIHKLNAINMLLGFTQNTHKSLFGKYLEEQISKLKEDCSKNHSVIKEIVNKDLNLTQNNDRDN